MRDGSRLGEPGGGPHPAFCASVLSPQGQTAGVSGVSDSPVTPATPVWPVTVELPVAWGEMDAFGHVNNTVYLRWFESARMAYFDVAGVLARMKADGVGPILARATVDFRKPVTFPDRVSVSARIAELRNTSFTMTYRATSESLGGAVVAEGDSVVVLVSYVTGDKVPLPPSLRARIADLQASGALSAAPSPTRPEDR